MFEIDILCTSFRLPKKYAAFFGMSCVVSDMLLLVSKNHKVFRTIIVLVAVDVVNDFPFSKRSTELLFCDYSMFVTSAAF